VPEDEELQALLISEFHDSKYAGHFGISRTRVAVGRIFWWKSLAGDVAKFVSTCVVCQRNKCPAVPPRPCLGSIAIHDIRCTAVTPFIKDCLTEAILIPLMHHAAAVPLNTKRMIT
jgi:hypothetical protein